MPSNFTFLESEQSLSSIYQNALGAEKCAITDTRASGVYARLTLETAIKWMYAHDRDLTAPYDDNLNAMMKETSFRNELPPEVFRSCETVRKQGNQACHDSRAIRPETSLFVVQQLHNFLFWFYRAYFDSSIKSKFDASLIPDGRESTSKLDEAVKLAEKLQQELEEHKQKVLIMEQEQERRIVQAGENKRKAFSIKDSHDYNEDDTRKFLIDLWLREVGWEVGSELVSTEFQLTNVERNKSGTGRADYVLWGSDGKPLAVIEAKKSSVDRNQGKRQAYDYANALEKLFGQRPIIFYTNGYEHTIWDDSFYPPRSVQGFYKKDELERLVMQRNSRKELAQESVNETIAGRPYQKLAIQAVNEHFTKGHRKALLVMATGTGKTRTTIALTELLQKANWAKRILFLCDRDALLTQANKAFTEHLPHTPSVDLRTAKTDTTSRMCLCTYGTMINLIDTYEDGVRQFGSGHFDLIVIDEAHRSVYQKYRAIFDYFDSLLVGLTATPRSEADKDTYGLFDMETGVPVYAYELDEAVKQGYLVDYKKVPVSSTLSREGITYSKLSEAEKLEYEKHFSDEDDVPEKISKDALNKWLFNQSTVDGFLKHLMENGIRVEGGDKLGKTIIFAKNKDHAKYIVERFDANYPEYKGKFCAQIDYSVGSKDVESLIAHFKVKNDTPQVAVSVDMLDTGIDVPEIVNLVFAKPVYSKTKFWQMIGRGTRLCKNLFAPNDDKREFVIFDYCNNFEFFEMNPEGKITNSQQTLTEKIFLSHLKITTMLQKSEENRDIYQKSVEFLKSFVKSMNRDNFIVRPHLQFVDKYSHDAIWEVITKEKQSELTNHIATLPTTMEIGTESERRWDNMLLRSQLEVLEKKPVSVRKEIELIASALEDKKTIPLVKEKIDLIRSMGKDEFWETLTPSKVEEVRDDMRVLTRYLSGNEQKPIYTNFSDTVEAGISEERAISYDDMSQYRKKMEQLIREHENHIAINKIKQCKPLTPTDILEIESMLFHGDSENKQKFEKAFSNKIQSHLEIETPTIGTLIRSIVGLDRAAVESVFSSFIDKTSYNTQQYHFINQLIQFFVRDGFVSVGALYDPPFSDIHEGGPDELFDEESADNLFELIGRMNSFAG